jgi:hypothetical protein
MFGAAKKPTIVRTISTVTVKDDKGRTSTPKPMRSSQHQFSKSSANKISRADPYAMRRTSSPASTSSAARNLSVPKPSLKRKTRSPSVQHVTLSSDDDDDNDDEVEPAATVLTARKRHKPVASRRMLDPSEDRHVFDLVDWEKKAAHLLPVFSSTQIVTGQHEKEYKPSQWRDTEHNPVVMLQYPSLNCPQER